MKKEDIYKNMENDILNSELDENKKNKILKNIFDLKQKKLNIMITGATGCGKSSTINALFDTEVAKVGIGVDPETMDITKYELNNLTLWDSPGLGDGKEADNRHAKNIINKLVETDNQGNALIDLVLVILDGGSRDLGTSYELINNVIIPNLGNDKSRILVAINQADVAMKGRYWNFEENKPENELIKFLEQKVESIKKRILEGTNVNVNPIYYSAGYKEEGEKQNPYNLSKLLYHILEHTPKEKRIAYIDNISNNESMWKDNDELKNYNEEIKRSLMESIVEGVTKGAEIGGKMGKAILGETGEKLGKVGGGIIGGVIEGGKVLYNEAKQKINEFKSNVKSLFGC